MKIPNEEKRLRQFYGKVDDKHIHSFSRFLKGDKVLDIGTGLGSTTGYITNHYPEVSCLGVDMLEENIQKAKGFFPNAEFSVVNAEKMPFDNGAFTTIILRDVLHHLYEESDFDLVASEIKRVSSAGARLLILDPNVQMMLKFFRFISAHKDAECKFETALELLPKMGFTKKETTFHTLYSLPLSGGYVGVNFVPNIGFVQKSILGSERFFEKALNSVGLGRYLCWRYLIVADKI
ncbi:MAG: hypothetical protein C0594_00375 [Marinilabiliales bacterium]|nr:MAG: hypothetical protein C0594_00375 [Marinilabiliales bacterium]